MLLKALGVALGLSGLCMSAAIAQTITGDDNTIRLGNNDTVRLGNAPDITRQTRIAAKSAPAASLRGLDIMTFGSFVANLITGHRLWLPVKVRRAR